MEEKVEYKRPEELTDEELLDRLKERYERSIIPPCWVCGGQLSLEKAGGGEPTEWACSPQEEDPDRPGRLRYKPGRSFLDKHYSDSYYSDPRQGGDASVMELIRRFVETSTLANLGWELSRYAASIKKKSAKEWKEWVDGLIEKIEELQNFKKSMVRPEGK